jgi:hypothetical protein
MSDKKKFNVFISYARNDDQIADEVTRLLKESGLNVWVDESIKIGTNWREKIDDALEKSDYIISLLTTKSYSSDYVRKELDHALFNNKYKNNFLPVLIGSGKDDEFNRLPWLIKKINHLRVSDKKQPKAIADEIAKYFFLHVNTKEGQK